MLATFQLRIFYILSKNLNIKTNIIKVIKSSRMRCREHVVCMGEMRNTYKILNGYPMGTGGSFPGGKAAEA
jgi:hypothetical protein